MTELYGIACVASFLLLVAYIGFYNKKDLWFLMTFVSLLVCNSGYFTMALSRNLEEALLANRIAYLGSVFMPFFLLMTVMKICRFRYKIALPFALTFVNLIMLLITISSGYCGIYYKTVYFRIINGTGMLVKEYGPLHSLYYIYIFGYFAAMVLVITLSFFKSKIVSYKRALYLTAAVFVNIIIYIGEKALGIKFEFLSYSYIIAASFLLVIYKAMEDYDTDRILQASFETEKGGILLFAPDKIFKGCNDTAAEIIPELAELKLEYPIPHGDYVLQETIVPVLEGREGAENMTCRSGDKIYRIVAKPFYRKGDVNGKFLGTSIVISDDTAQQEYLRLISSYNEKLEEEVAQKTRHVTEMHNNLILSMADMVEGRDPNTGGHIKRTSSVVAIFTKKLEEKGIEGGSKTFFKNVAKAAPMHDLGKIAIDDAILRKPGKYSAEEYAVMQTHSAKGAEIVGKILKPEDDPEFYKIAVNVAHYHHEKFDGTGYPEKLLGESIPLEARIMALADVFDALVSKRCYKEKYSYDEAFKIIRESLGGQFDPVLGEIFLSCSKQLTDCYDALE